MPFRWRDIFARENTLAKAAATQAVEAHADPHIVLATSIRELQDEHDKLEHACALVIANYTQAKERLERDLEANKQLDAQGKAAAAAGHADAAQAIAHQLVAIRSRLKVEQAAFDSGKQKADEAKAAFAENGELLQAKMAEAKELDAEIDQAAMEHNMNQAMASVTAMTSHGTPSFDQVRDRIAAQHAEEEATASLRSSDPDLSAVHEQHLLNTAAADDVMAGWEAPSRSTGKATTTKSESPTDRLNA